MYYRVCQEYLYKLYQIYECLMDKDETAIS